PRVIPGLCTFKPYGLGDPANTFISRWPIYYPRRTWRASTTITTGETRGRETSYPSLNPEGVEQNQDRNRPPTEKHPVIITTSVPVAEPYYATWTQQLSDIQSPRG